MRVGLAFVAGMVGWTVMVALMALMRAANMTEMNLSLIVGSLFTADAAAGTWILGFILGLVISGLIALIYAAAFEGIRRSTWWLGLIGGAIHAAIGGLFFAALSSFHPGMPEPIMPPGAYGANYGTATVIGFIALHLIFGAIVGGMYRTVHIPAPPIRREPIPEEQTVGAGPERRIP